MIAQPSEMLQHPVLRVCGIDRAAVTSLPGNIQTVHNIAHKV